MADRIRAKLTEGLSFDVDMDGHRIVLDAAEAAGGKNRGPRPKPMLLAGLSGCTGMDVASILRKMRMPFDSLEIEVEAEASETDPKVYTQILIRYILRGDRLDHAKISKAVALSQETYCGVSAMLGKTANIQTEIFLNP